jgi:hypothetical protein
MAKNHMSKSKLLYDWRFTANQFVLATNPLRPTTSIYFQLNPSSHSPYVTSYPDEKLDLSLMSMLRLVKCTYRTYNMSLRILAFSLHTSPVSTGFTEHIIPLLSILCYNGSSSTSCDVFGVRH